MGGADPEGAAAGRPALKGLFGIFAALMLAAGTAGAADAPLPPYAGKTPFTAITPEAQVARMKAGINIIGGYDPWWTGGDSHFSPSDFALVKAAGFTSIRVPLFSFAHMRNDGHLDPLWMKKLDSLVALAEANGLDIILDEHDFDDCAKDTDSCAVILSNVWYDLSEHFRNAPSSVMFELLNEPHGAIDASLWNSWAGDLIGIVRQTNPDRNIVVGPVGWNSLSELPNLKLPADDKHLIVTFHYYSPMTFTHQGATWAGPENEKARGVRWTGTADEVATVNADFDTVAAWAKANKRPILLGEFGTYNLYGKLDDRTLWTKTVAQAADARGFARAYWYFDGSFGVYDADKRQWIAPIRDALVPGAKP